MCAVLYPNVWPNATFRSAKRYVPFCARQSSVVLMCCLCVLIFGFFCGQVYLSMSEGPEAVERNSVQCVSLFRESKALRKYAPIMSKLLVALVEGAELQDAVTVTGK